ncbi:hypothetical protein TEA_000734 [Camellia sinensis var. sinensis]|uniref:inositol oxygenase n=1 Tax=Camellia sinensis var. sinensis TaxID=542762 RepID=A0A4S4F163_CAMSN|nr:hypothetical protein TEA_000734 [Camellia sinensis var. sinensis]
MRQVGVLCAAALVAVQEIVGKLESDHNNAKFLAQGLNRIEGLKVVVNSVETNIVNVPVPAACVILICLFALQHYGSHKIGFMFAPVVILWLLLISGVSLYNICHYDPQIIYAISPTYMYRFMRRISPGSWGLLGSILLCAAGWIRSNVCRSRSFLEEIYHALVLCYAGQAAFISKNLGVSKDVFLLSESVPNRSIRHIFRVLSLFASAVGSQATITASFSIINQCLALGCFPRVKVIHTSDKIHGQVYIPDVNWMLMLFNIAITIGFRNISLIGNATGSIRHIFRVLSLFASAVGSQATITASFSIINQCLALGCFPRVKVIHTSDTIHGQVYIPDVNWILMLFNIAITIGFRNISLIGNATGDTFPLGCAFDELIVYHKYFEYNLDSKNSTYSTKNGIYLEGCGLDNVMISWGHDDYMYLVVKEHGTTLPPAALFII